MESGFQRSRSSADVSRARELFYAEAKRLSGIAATTTTTTLGASNINTSLASPKKATPRAGYKYKKPEWFWGFGVNWKLAEGEKLGFSTGRVNNGEKLPVKLMVEERWLRRG